MDGHRYETKIVPHTKRPCTGCGGFRWSAKGECLNASCMSDEERERIFGKRPRKKVRHHE